MKLRFALILLTLVLSLAISADRTPNNCSEAWSPTANSQTLESGLGVNIHFTEARPGEIKLIADAGFRWVRMDFKWDETEREPGRYDFSAYDRLMSSLSEYRIQALFILDYGNPLYDNDAPPRTDESRRAFARWATAAAKHFGGRGVIWEIYNEPNTAMFWPPRPNPEEYIALALAVGRAFRAEVPDEKLIGPATAGIDFPFLEACFKAGLLDYWSAVSVHPYRKTDPEQTANDYCRLREMIERYRTTTNWGNERISAGREIPIISGEWGYSAVWRNMNEEKQGALFARQMLTNVANRIPISIWYDWRDDGRDPGEAEHNFGLVRHDYRAGQAQVYEPKPAFQAAKTISNFFTGYRFDKRLIVGSNDDYVLVFARGGERHIAAWTTSTAAHRITIPLEAGEYKLTTHIGESSIAHSANPPGLSIEVSTAPVYIAPVK
jgi:hypothetical protein